MRQCKQVILLLFVFFSFEGCSTIKKFFPGNEKSLVDISFELIENLSTAFSEGKLQALEEMIAIYNDSNQPFDVRTVSYTHLRAHET